MGWKSRLYALSPALLAGAYAAGACTHRIFGFESTVRDAYAFSALLAGSTASIALLLYPSAKASHEDAKKQVLEQKHWTDFIVNHPLRNSAAFAAIYFIPTTASIRSMFANTSAPLTLEALWHLSTLFSTAAIAEASYTVLCHIGTFKKPFIQNLARATCAFAKSRLCPERKKECLETIIDSLADSPQKSLEEARLALLNRDSAGALRYYESFAYARRNRPLVNVFSLAERTEFEGNGVEGKIKMLVMQNRKKLASRIESETYNTPDETAFNAILASCIGMPDLAAKQLKMLVQNSANTKLVGGRRVYSLELGDYARQTVLIKKHFSQDTAASEMQNTEMMCKQLPRDKNYSAVAPLAAFSINDKHYLGMKHATGRTATGIIEELEPIPKAQLLEGITKYLALIHKAMPAASHKEPLALLERKLEKTEWLELDKKFEIYYSLRELLSLNSNVYVFDKDPHTDNWIVSEEGIIALDFEERGATLLEWEIAKILSRLKPAHAITSSHYAEDIYRPEYEKLSGKSLAKAELCWRVRLSQYPAVITRLSTIQTEDECHGINFLKIAMQDCGMLLEHNSENFNRSQAEALKTLKIALSSISENL